MKDVITRLLQPHDLASIKQACDIHNLRWVNLTKTYEEFETWITNGLVFAAFNTQNKVLGSITVVQLNESDIMKYGTYSQFTGNETLSNHNENGDSLVCISISVAPSDDSKCPLESPVEQNKSYEELKKLSKTEIEKYIALGDKVIKFHEKPKGGLLQGAKILKYLPDSRPTDIEAVGYNILMKYPSVPSATAIIQNIQRPSFALIEAVMIYAQEHTIGNIFALTRPSGLRRYLLNI